ncbi:WD40-repeat-containing domain protein [Chytridium lagenaria]|nr:WD40-repeat-containing domain protein [Chytridium lagenaria]
MQLLQTTSDTFHSKRISSFRSIISDRRDESFHFKNVLWSPDGTCLLSGSNDDIIRIYEVKIPQNEDKDPAPMVESVSSKVGSSIYDYCWYPLMHSLDPPSCCFITSSRDHPLQLWDAYNGTLRASYGSYSSGDYIKAPYSVTFSPDGSQVIGGLESRIVLFDISRPGYEYTEIFTVKSKRTKGGQKGIVSALRYSPDNNGLIAAGNFRNQIGLYDTRTSEMISKCRAPNAVTQLEFYDSLTLYAASRKSDTISCFDLRNTKVPFMELERPGDTNQRVYFSLIQTLSLLATGDTEGNLRVFDLQNPKDTLAPIQTTPISNSTVCGASFHPYSNYVAVASGDRGLSLNDDYEDPIPSLSTISVYSLPPIDPLPDLAI